MIAPISAAAGIDTPERGKHRLLHHGEFRRVQQSLHHRHQPTKHDAQNHPGQDHPRYVCRALPQKQPEQHYRRTDQRQCLKAKTQHARDLRQPAPQKVATSSVSISTPPNSATNGRLARRLSPRQRETRLGAKSPTKGKASTVTSTSAVNATTMASRSARVRA